MDQPRSNQCLITDLQAVVERVCQHLMQPSAMLLSTRPSRSAKRSRHSRLCDQAESLHAVRQAGGLAMASDWSPLSPEYRQAVCGLLEAYERVRSRPVAWCRTGPDDTRTAMVNDIYRQLWVLTERFAPGIVAPPTVAEREVERGRVPCATCNADMNPAGGGVCEACGTVLYEGTMNHLVAGRPLVPRSGPLHRFFFCCPRALSLSLSVCAAHHGPPRGPRRRPAGSIRVHANNPGCA